MARVELSASNEVSLLLRNFDMLPVAFAATPNITVPCLAVVISMELSAVDCMMFLNIREF